VRIGEVTQEEPFNRIADVLPRYNYHVLFPLSAVVLKKQPIFVVYLALLFGSDLINERR
jgi:hypothetical protein